MRWLTQRLEYTDGVVLPVGLQLPEPYDFVRNPSEFSAWHIAGAKACAKKLNVDSSGQRTSAPLTTAHEIQGELRIVHRSWTTDTQPDHESIPFRRVGAPDDARPVPAEQSRPINVESQPTNSQPTVERLRGQSEPSRPSAGLKFCGLVAVVDFMSLLVRAFKAGAPSQVHGVRSMLETICHVIDRLSPEFLVFALDGGHDHRTSLYPGYKGNRPPKEPELIEQIALGERVLQEIGWPSIRVKGWEADDILASMATQFDEVAAGVVLITSDKDALQVCASTRALVYHPWSDGVIINEERCADKYGVPFSMMNGFLSLSGDTSDSVPGVPGIGPKTAADLMRTHRSFEGVMAAAAAGKINGRIGKALQEHADAARLSRELVTLRTDLPVGIHWQRWPVAEPRKGWQRQLQELGLGGAAAKLSQRLSMGTDGDRGSSHIEVEINPATPAPTGRIASNGLNAVESENRAVALRIYDQAVAARLKHGKAAASGYFVGTLMRDAWDSGSTGAPFESIDVTKFDEFGRPRDRHREQLTSDKLEHAPEKPLGMIAAPPGTPVLAKRPATLF
jgi:5'-3' exonuclease